MKQWIETRGCKQGEMNSITLIFEKDHKLETARNPSNTTKNEKELR